MDEGSKSYIVILYEDGVHDLSFIALMVTSQC